MPIDALPFFADLYGPCGEPTTLELWAGNVELAHGQTEDGARPSWIRLEPDGDLPANTQMRILTPDSDRFELSFTTGDSRAVPIDDLPVPEVTGARYYSRRDLVVIDVAVALAGDPTSSAFRLRSGDGIAFFDSDDAISGASLRVYGIEDRPEEPVCVSVEQITLTGELAPVEACSAEAPVRVACSSTGFGGLSLAGVAAALVATRRRPRAS